jgi:hypothetical protein
MASLAGSVIGTVADKLLGPDVEKWFTLLLSLALSWLICFSGVAGLSLLAGQSWRIAVGGGLVAGATGLLLVSYRDPQAKKLFLVAPNAIDEKTGEPGMTVRAGK